MARAFVRASSQYLENASPATPSSGFSMACWAWVNNLTQAHCLMSLSDSGTAVNGHHLIAAGTTGGDPLQCKSNNAASSSGSAYPSGSWFHAGGNWSLDNLRTVYLNGVAGTANTTSVTPTLDVTCIGRRDNSTNDYLDGKIAEAAVWAQDLVQAEWTALANGVSPLAIRPHTLVAYWPLIGRASPERDIHGDVAGNFPLTVTGATATEHPRIVNMKGPRHVVPFGEDVFMMGLENGNVRVYKITEQPAALVWGLHIVIDTPLGVTTTFRVGNTSTELANLTKTAGSSGDFYLSGFSVADADIYVAAQQS